MTRTSTFPTVDRDFIRATVRAPVQAPLRAAARAPFLPPFLVALLLGVSLPLSAQQARAMSPPPVVAVAVAAAVTVAVEQVQEAGSPLPAAVRQTHETSELSKQQVRDTDGRPLPLAEYARWRSIDGSTISPDGAWVAWSYGQLRRDDELHVRHVESGREHTVERASRPSFSEDGRWAAYSVALPLEEIEKLEEDGKPVRRRAELMNLETGERIGWDNVASFDFSKGATHLAVRKNASDPKPDHGGTDLILHDLRSGTDELIGSVGWSGFNDPGTFLAYTVDGAAMDGNGLFLVALETGARRVLDNARAEYSRATWSEDGAAIAVLRGEHADSLTQRDNTLLAWTGLSSGNLASGNPARDPVRHEADAATVGLPSGHVISEKASLVWSEPANRLIFGFKEQEPKTEPAEGWQKASDVDVFHWNDDRIQSVQAKQVETDRNRTDRAAFLLERGEIVPLGDASITGITFSRDARWAIASDNRAYVSDWEEARADFYRIDVATGERHPFLMEHMRTLGLSPDGEHFLYWADDDVWAYALATDRHVNLTDGAPVSFANAEWDYLGTTPPYGVTGFTRDGRGVILEHRYDLWYVALDGGTHRNLTNDVGSEREIRFRYVRTDPEERTIDLSRPLLLSAYGAWTKMAGFYELRGDRLQELVYTDDRYSTPRKATNADRVLFTRQSWNDFPDLRISALDFEAPVRVTEANPQQAEYAWGRRILFDYENADGVKLQGTLAIPDSWTEGQRLPMLVNFYEKNSQNLHQHPTPRYTSAPQFADYVSNGYLVMQPDVHFRGGSSHSDMLECVEAAVRKVIELGYADPDHVGLHGHSYSGGGASYISTRSTMFAAIVAGAAPINLVGEFNILWRGNGQNNHRYDIHGQGRYGSNPYDDFDLYWNQSPIAHVETMDTPLLYMHGDNDQIVEYLQGMEFYNALRFNGKPVIFLSYPGEGHGLGKLENQLDYQRRMAQFYGHHLKGDPLPAWMERGEPFLDKPSRATIPVNVQSPEPIAAGSGGG